jgi:hypothetical protein
VNIYGDVTGRDKSGAGGSETTPPPGGVPASTASSAPPLELSIRFGRPRSKADDASFPVSVHVESIGLSTSTFSFKPPLDKQSRDDIQWYLELYPRWPVGPDFDRAAKIEANLLTWGQALFDAVFKHGRLMQVFDEFRHEDGAGHLLTIDATDPRVLRLPWELLADEDSYLFTQDPRIDIRRRLQKSKRSKTKPFDLPVRILMVVSRPDDVSFIDPRSSAGALLDAIKPLGDRVKVEFLYPPTLAALTQRVRNKELPPVHVVHFDGHGLYWPQTGLGYLIFENAEHKRQQVSADDLGALLHDTGVPLVVLDACQTARTDELDPFNNVAARLIKAGIASVLAMSYSVLVPATRILTSAFYTALAEGATIGQAVNLARLAMLSDPERFKLYRDNKEEAINCHVSGHRELFYFRKVSRHRELFSGSRM